MVADASGNIWSLSFFILFLPFLFFVGVVGCCLFVFSPRVLIYEEGGREEGIIAMFLKILLAFIKNYINLKFLRIFQSSFRDIN